MTRGIAPRRLWRNVRERLRLAVPRHIVREWAMGMDIEYDPRTSLGRQLYFKGGFERPEIEFCARLLSGIAEPVVVDVGANIGVHSLYWATQMKMLQGHLFEPCRRTADVLRRNIARNGLDDRLRVYEVALSAESGEADFYECSDNGFSSLKDTGRRPVVSTLRVPVSTFDQWAETVSIARLDLVKIDVEGLEREVLLGAKGTLESRRPHLFVEIFRGKRSNPDPEGTITFVQSLGYEAFIFAGKDGLKPFARHSDDHYNYYFRPC